jgi:hypothetical protein
MNRFVLRLMFVFGAAIGMAGTYLVADPDNMLMDRVESIVQVSRGEQTLEDANTATGDVDAIVADHLAWFDIDEYSIVKRGEKDDYTVVSISQDLDHKPVASNDQAPCDTYGGSDCINIIISGDSLLYSTLNDQTEEWSFYRFTDRWILFKFSLWEWSPCNMWWAEYFTYLHLDSLKTFYSKLSTRGTGVSPDPADELCESDDTERTYVELLNFYASSADRDDETKAIETNVKTTEAAFLEYYSDEVK